MTETLLRNFETTSGTQKDNKSSWIEQVSVMINELQTIMEIESMGDFKKGNRLSFEEDDDLAASGDTYQPWGI